ncbi:hypothetical protein J3R83DRAFT_632 [Lanmaoa asiatica]|nr:hypothetical protein J3R83DRAFT_632 [Lanmaoa asiatica]
MVIREFIFHELNINPKLLELPQVSAPLQSTSVPTVTKRKAEETPQHSGVDAAAQKLTSAIEPEHCVVGTLEHYFKHSSDHAHHPRPPKSRKVEATSLTSAVVQWSSQPDASSLAAHSVPAPAPTIPLTPSQPLLPSSLTQDMHGDQGRTSHKTRSQHLFAAATGINPESLVIKGDDEFFLFMEMRAEFNWVSYEMTSRKWVEATEEYNCRLVRKVGTATIKKNPLALIRKLGEMEARLIDRVLRDDFKSKRNTEAFWRHHCFVVNLVKANTTTGKKPRKVPTCSRCKTIMYPGPEKSATNHKRGICADGVRSKLTPELPELPHWPQPHGVFSDGETFHPQAFFKMVQEVYEITVLGSAVGLTVLLVEAQAFLLMLAARLIILTDADGQPTLALFKLYPGFKIDNSVSSDHIVQHEGAEYLRVNYLEHEA